MRSQCTGRRDREEESGGGNCRSSTDRRDDVLSCGLEYRDGPGPEVVAFCVVLSNGALVLLWLVLDRLARVNDTVTIERDVKAGWRVAGCGRSRRMRRQHFCWTQIAITAA